MGAKPYPRIELHPRCKRLGELFRQERLSRGWTLTDLAERTGYSRQTHRDIEEGRIPANSDIECRVEDAFGKPIWTFWQTVFREEAGLMPPPRQDPAVARS